MDSTRFVQNHLLKRSPLSNILAPLGWVYGQVMLLRRKYCYPHPYRSRHKIISIGNLSAGGSGKTPITIALAQAMSQSGLKVAVSHRGYKGEAEHGLALVSDRDKILLNARQAGDEAVLIASSLPGIPVVAGKNRARALRLLESRFPDLDCIIMDDTFQHLAVARDLDFVVCDTAIGFANGRCLPAGYLREPVSVLNEDIVVLLHQKPGSPPATREQRRIVLRYTPLFYNVYSTSDHLTDCSGNAVSPSVLEGKRIALVSGIASPYSFAAAVSDLGISYQHHFKYPDHYDFQDQKELSALQDWDHLICTTKDFVKLSPHPSLCPKLLSLNLHTRLPKEMINFVVDSIQSTN